MMTFRDFQASRTRGDVSETYGDDANPVTGFNYAQGLQIADTDDSLGKHWLVISNLERVSDDLELLECILWADTRMQDDVIQGVDLDHYARGYLAAIGKRYDRDLCAIALARPHSVRDAQTVLDSMSTNRLYLERA